MLICWTSERFRRNSVGNGDSDRDVDLFYLLLFDMCRGLPDISPNDGCRLFDLDSDGDVDWRDFSVMQRAF